MSVIHVNQIKNRVRTLFENKIDLTGLRGTPDALDSHFLTRALAAYAIHCLTKADVDLAAASIVDGGDDNGIDAIFIDESEKRLCVVQSKWIHDGKGEPANADVKKFSHGIRDLFNCSFDRFNAKVNAKRTAIEKALNDATYRYDVVLVHTGVSDLAQHSRRDLDDLAEEMNDASEVLFIQTLNQAALHASLASPLAGEPINLAITLYSWGKVERPHVAFYGQVNGSEIAQWWDHFGTRLFAKNLRSVLGDTDVNEEIRKTISHDPTHFWYFNNGITIVAQKVAKTMAGGGDRDFGTFQCTEISVVNGAQTVSTLGKAAKKLGALGDDIRIPLRVISLEGCPPEFGPSVTRSNNRQNRIENRDFVSQDTVQLELQRELAIEGIDYSLMRSDTFIATDKSFDLVESTTALACASGKPSLVVQLKREISRLWEDISKAPYKELFNPSVTSTYLWRTVQLQRIIDRSVAAVLSQETGRDYAIAVHGNRLIAAIAFSSMNLQTLSDPAMTFDIDAHRIKLEIATSAAHKLLTESIAHAFPNAILPTLFKNASKCHNLFHPCVNQLKDKITEQRGSPATGTLDQP